MLVSGLYHGRQTLESKLSILSSSYKQKNNTGLKAHAAYIYKSRPMIIINQTYFTVLILTTFCFDQGPYAVHTPFVKTVLILIFSDFLAESFPLYT